MLAFWCGPDENRIDRLFRQSCLVREKWENPADYRSETISKAILGTKEFYAWNGTRTVKGGSSIDPDGIGDSCFRGKITNGSQTGEGKDRQLIPLPMREVLANFRGATGNWPGALGGRFLLTSTVPFPG